MTLRVGLNVDAAGLPAALKAFPGYDSARVFAGPGKGLPAWTSTMVTTLRKAGKTCHFSFKDWADDLSAIAAVVAWLDAMPADIKRCILTWHHEPEGDRMDSFEYRRRWVLLASVVRAHPNGARVLLYPIHTWYPSRFKIGDNYSPDWTTWVGVWQQWAPIDHAGYYVGNAISFDCYLPVNSTRYMPPVEFFRIPVSAAHALGVPLAISELGALRTPTDTTGTGRASWITHCVAYLRSVDAVQANWWHSTGTGGYNYRLTDTPSIAAWRNAIAGNVGP